MTKRKYLKAFTIVEMIIIIVVIGILAAISAVTYNGVREKSLNANRIVEFKSWERLFKLYHAKYGEYPNVPRGSNTEPRSYCLGTGFPKGPDGEERCRDYEYACSNYINPECTSFRVADSVQLMNELKKVGTVSEAPKWAVDGTVGPYVEFFQDFILMHGWFSGSKLEDCPDGTDQSWTDNNKQVACMKMIQEWE